MSNDEIDVLVLRQDTHGLPAEAYTMALQEQLPAHDVRLARTPTEERRLIRSARVVTSVDVEEDLLTGADELQLFAGVAAGYNHLPLDTLSDMNVAVTNASGIHAPNIAEQVLGNVLVFSRRLHEGWRRQQRREWRHYQAYELQDSTVTIVGLGSIGQAIAERFDGFDVKTIGVRYTPSKGGPTDEVIPFDSEELHSALARTDYLLLACPLSDTTRGLIGAEEFETLSPNAILVNVGRGPVVETDALLAALRNNAIRGAALDVTDPEPLPEDHPLWNFGNVLITPHNAGHTPKHWDRLADIVAGNVELLDTGSDYEEFENVVLSPTDR